MSGSSFFNNTAFDRGGAVGIFNITTISMTQVRAAGDRM